MKLLTVLIIGFSLFSCATSRQVTGTLVDKEIVTIKCLASFQKAMGDINCDKKGYQLVFSLSDNTIGFVNATDNYYYTAEKGEVRELTCRLNSCWPTRQDQ